MKIHINFADNKQTKTIAELTYPIRSDNVLLYRIFIEPLEHLKPFIPECNNYTLEVLIIDVLYTISKYTVDNDMDSTDIDKVAQHYVKIYNELNRTTRIKNNLQIYLFYVYLRIIDFLTEKCDEYWSDANTPDITEFKFKSRIFTTNINSDAIKILLP